MVTPKREQHFRGNEILWLLFPWEQSQRLATGFEQDKAGTGIRGGECGFHTEGPLGLCQEPQASQCQEGPH